MRRLSAELRQLENDAVFILRETVARLDRPVLLFSAGKDSVVLAELARRAFHPCPLPFPFMHIDTGHNFPETLSFRDRYVHQHKLDLLVVSVKEAIKKGLAREEDGPRPSRNRAQSAALLDAIARHGFDGCLTGARRDEDRTRAKERLFSHRDRFGQWNPQKQRPELWDICNTNRQPGEHFRIFPLSDWTEGDIWRYIQARELDLPSLYFAHQREVVRGRGPLLAHSELVRPQHGERVERLLVRFRTVGDMTCTGAVESTATDVEQVLHELASCRQSERVGRADDQRSSFSMEDRKRVGYF